MTVVIHPHWESAPRETHAVWASLVNGGDFNPSLHPDWLGITLSAWGVLRSTSIAVVRSGESDIAVIPFMVRKHSILGIPIRCLELASNAFCYHAEIVASGNLERAVIEFLRCRQLPPWDAFRAVNLVAGGSTSTAIRSATREALAGVSTRSTEQSPYAVIDQDWSGYLSTRSKKVRANVTRSQRLMRDAGETGMSWYQNGDTSRLLEEMLHIESRSWKAASGAAVVAGTPQYAYYEQLLPWLAKHDALMANVLYIQRRPVAYTLCAAWRGWVGQLKTSFSQELRDAGSRVIHASLERAFNSNANREYDFLGDIAPHKTRWADNIRSHEELWAFPRHVRGTLFSKIKALTDRWHRQRAMQVETTKDDELEPGSTK
jgi:hypothetical protein